MLDVGSIVLISILVALVVTMVVLMITVVYYGPIGANSNNNSGTANVIFAVDNVLSTGVVNKVLGNR